MSDQLSPAGVANLLQCLVKMVAGSLSRAEYERAEELAIEIQRLAKELSVELWKINNVSGVVKQRKSNEQS